MAGLLVLDVTEALGWEVGAAAFLCCELELFELGFPVGKKATQNMSEILSFTESESDRNTRTNFNITFKMLT